jgi:iodotyrosine deiodinase
MPEPAFIPIEFKRFHPDRQSARARAFYGMLRTRRTIRDFAPDPVPFELIETAIRAAATAPSGANRQPWHFVAISSHGVKQKIREAAEAEEREFYDHRAPEEWLEALQPLGTDWHKPFLEIAPWLIVVFREDYGLMNSGEKEKNYYVMESVGIACGFLLAALHAAGLATLTHTPSPMGFLSQILNRPKNEKPYLLIPVGYPAAGAQVPNIQKKPLPKIMTVIS